MTTGMTFLMTRPGFITPMLLMPTPDLAVPYAAPMSGVCVCVCVCEWGGGAKMFFILFFVSGEV